MNYVNIELDRSRRLRYDVNALSDAEEALGMGLGTVMQSQLGIRMIRALLWAGLKWEDRGLTLQQTGTLIQQYIEKGGSLESLGEKLTQALVASGLFGKEEGNSKAEAAE